MNKSAGDSKMSTSSSHSLGSSPSHNNTPNKGNNDGNNDSTSTISHLQNTTPLKSILKNRSELSPVAPHALPYREPSDLETSSATNLIDNNYEETRFSKLVDSRTLYERKIQKGLLKRSPKKLIDESGSSGSSSPEPIKFQFRPKRKEEGDDGDSSTGSSSA